ncbi:hypothetical protein QWY93_07770 [Echinicola jeungdonensis]|uniref:Anti-sigma factor n=1 Tax=Echinicola jeungdonensis TaxID=709343 RepID=A0ABV5J7Q3_9BACT|nr:hypothetical protein [Echinicola jeungdonensis]MDN3669222.1 hypothetical protein [Echinicola jeungdonensis]
MTKSFTPNDLVRYIYQEMSESESEQLEHNLHRDEELMQNYIDLLSAVEHLETLYMEPSEKVVSNIKKKAKSIGLEKV